MARSICRFATLALGGTGLLLAEGSVSPAAEPARTVVTVTTTSAAANGAVATVQGLLANPGPDGLSITEAIMATNNEPGAYEVRFARALAGRTIDVGDLPALTGGGVVIDGDVDGNRRPDITIRYRFPGERCGGSGFVLSSGGNRLHALRLRDFFDGVRLSPTAGRRLPSHRTYAGNEVSRLDMHVCHAGIWLAPTGYRNCERRACATLIAGWTRGSSATRSSRASRGSSSSWPAPSANASNGSRSRAT